MSSSTASDQLLRNQTAATVGVVARRTSSSPALDPLDTKAEVDANDGRTRSGSSPRLHSVCGLPFHHPRSIAYDRQRRLEPRRSASAPSHRDFEINLHETDPRATTCRCYRDQSNCSPLPLPVREPFRRRDWRRPRTSDATCRGLRAPTVPRYRRPSPSLRAQRSNPALHEMVRRRGSKSGRVVTVSRTWTAPFG